MPQSEGGGEALCTVGETHLSTLTGISFLYLCLIGYNLRFKCNEDRFLLTHTEVCNLSK
jgi:hypothetical protein